MVRWFRDSVCLFAIETTFPLSNFKTKHIFGILVERVTFLKPFGAPPERGARGAPNSFLLFYRRRRRRKLTPRPGPPGAPNMLMAPQIFYIFFSYYSFTAAEGGGYLNGRHRHPNEGAQGTQRWRRGRHFPGGATSPLGEGNPAEGGSSRVCF